MNKHFHRDMDQLHREVLSLFGLVEKMIGDAVRALVDRRYELIPDILAADDQVDKAEVHIEEECLKMLALHHPFATDLRRLTTVLKLNADLERIGDLACNIAERAQGLQKFRNFPIPDVIPGMVKSATDMVRMALDAFVNLDVELAKQVIASDEKVDADNKVAIQELIKMMANDTAVVEPALHCFSAVRQIERIGDHAENIAEDVLYLVAGEIVRHQHGEY